jgi:hypothetical protein
MADFFDGSTGGSVRDGASPLSATERAQSQYKQTQAAKDLVDNDAKTKALSDALKAKRNATTATAKNVAANASQYVTVPVPAVEDADYVSDFREIVINGMRFNDGKNGPDDVYAYPSSPGRKFRIDTIETPGIEYEQLKFKGRSLLTFKIDFKTYSDAGLVNLVQLAKMLVAPLSDTGVKLVAPQVHKILWRATLAAGMKNFVVVEDDGLVLYDDQGRFHHWGCTFRQFAQWKGPGVLPFRDANAGAVADADNAANPQTPGFQQPTGAQTLTQFGM